MRNVKRVKREEAEKMRSHKADHHVNNDSKQEHTHAPPSVSSTEPSTAAGGKGSEMLASVTSTTL